MVHRVRLPGVHDLVHAHFITDRTQQGHDFNVRPVIVRHQGLQLLVNQIEREFTHVHQQQLLGMGFKDLPAQLTANAAACPGHQHGFVVGVQVEQQTIGLDRLTAQQVVNVQLAHIAQFDFARGNVAQARQRAHRHLVRFERIQNLIAPLARHAGQCQQHIGYQ